MPGELREAHASDWLGAQGVDRQSVLIGQHISEKARQHISGNVVLGNSFK